MTNKRICQIAFTIEPSYLQLWNMFTIFSGQFLLIPSVSASRIAGSPSTKNLTNNIAMKPYKMIFLTGNLLKSLNLLDYFRRANFWPESDRKWLPGKFLRFLTWYLTRTPRRGRKNRRLNNWHKILRSWTKNISSWGCRKNALRMWIWVTQRVICSQTFENCGNR